MNPMLYHYDAVTFEYLTSLESRLDPLAGTPIVPANATLIEPPLAGENQVAVYDSTDWELKPDYRGEAWYMPDGTPITFIEIGQEPTPEMSETMPLDAALDNSKTIKMLEMDNACADDITSGFSSNALGTAYNYPYNTVDQLNLNACVIESLINITWSGPFWCEDTNGIWDRRIHDATQIQTARVDGAIHTRSNQDKLKIKREEIQAATTVEQVEAIVW